MKKPLWWLASLAILAVPVFALAGAKTTPKVVVVPRGASGGIGAARNSANTVERIGCVLTGTNGYQPLGGSCAAVSESGTQGVCHFQSKPDLAQVVASIQGDSQIVFEWDDLGRCHTISVRRNSEYEPKR